MESDAQLRHLRLDDSNETYLFFENDSNNLFLFQKNSLQACRGDVEENVGSEGNGEGGDEGDEEQDEEDDVEEELGAAEREDADEEKDVSTFVSVRGTSIQLKLCKVTNLRQNFCQAIHRGNF